MAVIVDVADAVTQELNQPAFALPAPATRMYLPRFELAEMTTLHVTVVPRSLAGKSLDRHRDTFDYRIDIAVQQKVEPAVATLDTLMSMVERIADHFRGRPLASYPMARCVEVENTPVYAPEHLDQFRQFTSVITLTLRVWR